MCVAGYVWGSYEHSQSFTTAGVAYKPQTWQAVRQQLLLLCLGALCEAEVRGSGCQLVFIVSRFVNICPFLCWEQKTDHKAEITTI